LSNTVCLSLQSIDAKYNKTYAISTTGHFLSASITWEQLEGNTVLFEITSAWRRKHLWPCNKDQGFNGPDGFPGLGQELAIVGLSMVQDVNAKSQEAAGEVSAKFYPGDGTAYDLMLKVTSFSIIEDWVMGVSYIKHTYPRAQASLVPFYPSHYVASRGDKKNSQPYNTVPWFAEFTGCCRQFKGASPLGEAVSFNFGISATVDLDDHVASARIVSMPFIYVYPGMKNILPVCALSLAGPAGMVMKVLSLLALLVQKYKN
jgi:hypothetical protein